MIYSVPNQTVEGTGPGVSVFDGSGFIWISALFGERGQPVPHLSRSLRHEVMSATAWRGFFLTKPCFSQQVFYGSRRLAGGASYCHGSEASQTM